MLVLSRSASQSITIGPDITVTVLQSRNGRTLLGIDAPPSVVILRSELATHTHDKQPVDAVDDTSEV